MNTRDLCRLMSAALGVQGVERYAARLVRADMMPQARMDVKELSTAALLLAVLAAPEPSQSVPALERLAGLPLTFIKTLMAGHPLIGAESWAAWPLTAEHDLPPTFGIAVAEEIEARAQLGVHAPGDWEL